MAIMQKTSFGKSTEGAEALRILQHMAVDALYNTPSSYSANVVMYPDNRIPFVDKHMQYLGTHPATDPQQYLANLRLKTRLR